MLSGCGPGSSPPWHSSTSRPPLHQVRYLGSSLQPKPRSGPCFHPRAYVRLDGLLGGKCHWLTLVQERLWPQVFIPACAHSVTFAELSQACFWRCRFSLFSPELVHQDLCFPPQTPNNLILQSPDPSSPARPWWLHSRVMSLPNPSPCDQL